MAGGGITVKGWQGRVDSGNRQNLAITDSKLAPEGSAMRLMTGAAGLYWNPANTGKGDFSVKATFDEAKQPYNHPHPYGVFIGGKGLDSDTPQALYCAAYQRQLHCPRLQRRQAVRGRAETDAERRSARAPRKHP